METSYLDWLLIALLLAAIPLVGLALHRRVSARVAAGIPNARIGGYIETIILEAGILLATVAVWLPAGRSWERLGLGFPEGRGWWVGAALALAAAGLLILQWRKLRGDDQKLRQMAGEFKSLEAMLPHNRREQLWFGAVSISAGICEEIAYRGFLLAVLSAIWGIWIAVPVSALVFGLAHSYQGPAGIAKTGAVGLFMAVLTVLTGSLWAAMFLHIVLDVTSGLIAQRIAGVSDAGGPTGIGTPAVRQLAQTGKPPGDSEIVHTS